MLLHARQRPVQVHRRRPRGAEGGDGRSQRPIIGIAFERQRHAIGCGGTDQRRAAHLHGADGMRRVFQRGQTKDAISVRQRGLVDDLDDGLRFDAPDAAGRGAIDFHGGHFTVWF